MDKDFLEECKSLNLDIERIKEDLEYLDKLSTDIKETMKSLYQLTIIHRYIKEQPIID
jgi:hypothetical protein